MAGSRFFGKPGFIAGTAILLLIAVVLLDRSEKTVSAETQQKIQLTRWNHEAQIFAEKRGNPWINVKGGKEILTEFCGCARIAL